MRLAGLGRWCVLVGALACSGDGGGDGDTGAGEELTDGPFRFDDLSDDEKFAYMASDVLPRMEQVFQAYDAEAYADFTCATCHVAGAQDGTYLMPDPGLPQLREEDFPYTSEVGEFMGQEVLPEIKELLGPTDGGRPCITCHTLEE